MPSRLDSPVLNDYVRHAQRFGVEEVYETAATYLGVEDLGRLAMQLRRIDQERLLAEREGRVRHRIEPLWHLTPAQRDELIERLIEAGAEDGRIREMARVTQPTIRSRRLSIERREQEPQPA